MRCVSGAVFGACSFYLLMASSAFAADMPSKAPPRVTPAINWTGFYLGGEIGAGWAGDTVTNVTGTAEFPAGYLHATNNPTGILGGIYGGYNYQVDPRWVVGLEGDFMWSGLQGNSTDIGVVAGNIAALNDKIDWVTTVTGRLGYAMDNWLLYGKAGWGWAHFKAFTALTTPAGAAVSTVTSDEVRNGWTVGVGAEWAITPRWLLRAEYDYLKFRTADFGATNVTPAGLVNVYARSATGYLNIAKLGLAYKF